MGAGASIGDNLDDLPIGNSVIGSQLPPTEQVRNFLSPFVFTLKKINYLYYLNDGFLFSHRIVKSHI